MNCPWPNCCGGLMFWKASGCQSYLKNRTRGWRPGRVRSQASKVQRGQARLPDQELTSVSETPGLKVSKPDKQLISEVSGVRKGGLPPPDVGHGPGNK